MFSAGYDFAAGAISGFGEMAQQGLMAASPLGTFDTASRLLNGSYFDTEMAKAKALMDLPGRASAWAANEYDRYRAALAQGDEATVLYKTTRLGLEGASLLAGAGMTRNVAGLEGALGNGLRVGENVANSGIVRPTSFASQEALEIHFGKHVVQNKEFQGLYKTSDEYLQGAIDVVQNGVPVKYLYKGEERTGFLRFAGTSAPKGAKPYGDAKFEFVGTNNGGHITTYHIESGPDFWKMLNNDKLLKHISPAE